MWHLLVKPQSPPPVIIGQGHFEENNVEMGRRGLVCLVIAVILWVSAIISIVHTIANRGGADIGAGFLILVAIPCTVVALRNLGSRHNTER